MYKLKSLQFTKFFEQAPFTFSNALHQALSPQSRQQGAATEHYSNTQCCSCNGTFGLQARAYVDTIYNILNVASHEERIHLNSSSSLLINHRTREGEGWQEMKWLGPKKR